MDTLKKVAFFRVIFVYSQTIEEDREVQKSDKLSPILHHLRWPPLRRMWKWEKSLSLLNLGEMMIVQRTVDRLIERLNGNILLKQSYTWTKACTIYIHRFLIGSKRPVLSNQNPVRAMEYQDCETLQELCSRVDEFIEYYNYNRYQWTLKR